MFQNTVRLHAFLAVFFSLAAAGLYLLSDQPHASAAPVPAELRTCVDCNCKMWTGFRHVTATTTNYYQIYVANGGGPDVPYPNAYPRPAAGYCAIGCTEGLPELEKDSENNQVFIKLKRSATGELLCDLEVRCRNQPANDERIEATATLPVLLGVTTSSICKVNQNGDPIP